MTPKFAATNYDFTPFIAARNYIGGEWVEPSGDHTLDIINPRHGKAMSTVTESTYEDIDDAVKAAQAVLAEWQAWPLRERAQVLSQASPRSTSPLWCLCG